MAYATRNRYQFKGHENSSGRTKDIYILVTIRPGTEQFEGNAIQTLFQAFQVEIGNVIAMQILVDIPVITTTK